MKRLLLLLPFLVAATECQGQRSLEKESVDRQQTVYLQTQPVPMYDYSLERDRIVGLYNARMSAAQTWSVWRSVTGLIEGDCPSSGYPLPYGVQLTSPEVKMYGVESVVPQAEPNGLFTNGITTNGTWVFCVVEGGKIAPVYVEDSVTVYPYAVKVDYDTNRVTRDGAPKVTLKK